MLQHQWTPDRSTRILNQQVAAFIRSFAPGVSVSDFKVRCPECQTSIRLTTDPQDNAAEFAVTCPKCQAEFTAEAPTTKSAAGPAAKTPAKAVRRRDEDDDDDDDDTPRRKK